MTDNLDNLTKLKVEATRLLDECEEQEKQTKRYAEEKAKLMDDWAKEKRQLEEKKSSLRLLEREIEDMRDKNGIEIAAYESKLRNYKTYLLVEATNAKSAGHEQILALENQQLEEEAIMQNNLSDERAKVRQSSLEHASAVYEMKKSHDLEVSGKMASIYLYYLYLSQCYKIRKEYDMRLKELQQKVALELRLLREHEDEKRKKTVNKIDEEKNAHIREVMAKHLQEFQNMKTYFGSITSGNLELIKKLKEDLAESRKRDAIESKQVSELQNRNNQLTEPLRRCEAEVLKLQEELENCDSEKKVLDEAKKSVGDLTKTFKQLQFLQEVLKQQYTKSLAAKEEIQRTFTCVSREVYKDITFENLLNSVASKSLEVGEDKNN